jgi:hypothetical protein
MLLRISRYTHPVSRIAALVEGVEQRHVEGIDRDGYII